MKKRLVESMEMAVVSTSLNLEIIFENVVSEWRGIPYSELSTLLGYLVYMAQLHHTNHWIASGDPFYGDHLLFDRLYSAANSEIDTLGEKVVGLGSPSNVDMAAIMSQANKWTSIVSQSGGTIPSRS